MVNDDQTTISKSDGKYDVTYKFTTKYFYSISTKFVNKIRRCCITEISQSITKYGSRSGQPKYEIF